MGEEHAVISVVLYLITDVIIICLLFLKSTDCSLREYDDIIQTVWYFNVLLLEVWERRDGMEHSVGYLLPLKASLHQIYFYQLCMYLTLIEMRHLWLLLYCTISSIKLLMHEAF